MSDLVMVALIAAVPGMFATFLGYLNNVQMRQANKSIDHSNRAIVSAQASIVETKSAIVDTKSAVVDTAKMLAETNVTMESIRHQTNDMKDALVKVTGESEFARGLKQGEDNPK